MRYIRVLSELSNNLRNATQKRVLVEVGLIKLCKPAMETNLDSVLDRSGCWKSRWKRNSDGGSSVFAGLCGNERRYSGTANPGSTICTGEETGKSSAGGSAADQGKLEKYRDADTGMFKTFLTTAVPKYNGNTGENKLYVEFSNDLAQTCVDDPDKKQLLEDLILQMTGKTVEVEMLLKKTNMHQDLAEISVDDILKQTVHMNIVVEEEPEDE